MDAQLRTFSECLLRLHIYARQLAPDAFQLRVLQELRTLLPFDFAGWGGGDQVNRVTTDLVVLDQSAGLFRDWEAVAHRDSFCDLALQRLNHPTLFDDVSGFRRDQVYNEHWRRFDVEDMMATVTAEPVEGYIRFLALCRGGANARFSKRDRRLKRLLMPHICEALRTNREVCTRGLAAPGEGVALVNQGGVIVDRQAPFDVLLREEWGCGTTCLPRRLLPADGTPAYWRGNAIQLHFSPIGSHHFLVRARLRHPMDQLTQREIQVAERYARGLDFREIASQLHIAPATVRNHLGRIYARLDIGSKAELAYLLASPGPPN